MDVNELATTVEIIRQVLRSQDEELKFLRSECTWLKEHSISQATTLAKLDRFRMQIENACRDY